MRCLLLGLTACWATSPPPSKAPVPARPIAAAPVAPAPAPPPAYQLPADVANALETEALAGNVLVPAYARLYPSAAAARADSSAHDLRGPVAMRVVRDHGDVVEVETAQIKDCIAAFEPPYQLTVFVQRAKLVPRAANDRIKAFADGTGVAIDAGAPIEITATGLAWRSDDLAATSVKPSEHQIAYAVPPFVHPAALPPVTGERMVCEYNMGVLTVAEWRAERKRTRDAQNREKVAQARAALEREREACYAKEAAAKKNAKPAGKVLAMSSCGIRDSLLDSDLAADSLGNERYDEQHFVPYCGVREPYPYASTPKSAVPPPTINGLAMPWPDGHSTAVESGGKLFADAEHGCGRTRMIVDRGGLGSTGSGMGMMGTAGQKQVSVWVPKPGPVTWPDGTPAGVYRGAKRYREVTEMGDRICVRVANVAELVCHDKRVAKTEMVFPSQLRD